MPGCVIAGGVAVAQHQVQGGDRTHSQVSHSPGVPQPQGLVPELVSCQWRFLG